MKLKEWLDIWLNKYTKFVVKLRTYERYKYIIEKHINPKLGEFELDDLSAMLFADARPLAFDVTGRIIIPDDLLKHAGITDKAIFVGRGNSFQIWNPDAFKKAQDKSLNNLRAVRPNLIIS